MFDSILSFGSRWSATVSESVQLILTGDKSREKALTETISFALKHDLVSTHKRGNTTEISIRGLGRTIRRYCRARGLSQPGFEKSLKLKMADAYILKLVTDLTFGNIPLHKARVSRDTLFGLCAEKMRFQRAYSASDIPTISQANRLLDQLRATLIVAESESGVMVSGEIDRLLNEPILLYLRSKYNAVARQSGQSPFVTKLLGVTTTDRVLTQIQRNSHWITDVAVGVLQPMVCMAGLAGAGASNPLVRASGLVVVTGACLPTAAAAGVGATAPYQSENEAEARHTRHAGNDKYWGEADILNSFEALPESDRTDAVWTQMGTFFRVQEDHQKAIWAFEHIPDDKRTSELRSKLALSYYTLERYEDARNCLESIPLEDRTSDIWETLGLSYYALGRNRNAVGAFKYMGLDSRRDQVLNRFASAYYRLGDFANSLEINLRIPEERRGHSDWDNIGVIYLQLGQYENMVNAAKRIPFEVRRETAHENLVSGLIHLGRPQEALDELNKLPQRQQNQGVWARLRSRINRALTMPDKNRQKTESKVWMWATAIGAAAGIAYMLNAKRADNGPNTGAAETSDASNQEDGEGSQSMSLRGTQRQHEMSEKQARDLERELRQLRSRVSRKGQELLTLGGNYNLGDMTLDAMSPGQLKKIEWDLRTKINAKKEADRIRPTVRRQLMEFRKKWKGYELKGADRINDMDLNTLKLMQKNIDAQDKANIAAKTKAELLSQRQRQIQEFERRWGAYSGDTAIKDMSTEDLRNLEIVIKRRHEACLRAEIETANRQAVEDANRRVAEWHDSATALLATLTATRSNDTTNSVRNALSKMNEDLQDHMSARSVYESEARQLAAQNAELFDRKMDSLMQDVDYFRTQLQNILTHAPQPNPGEGRVGQTGPDESASPVSIVGPFRAAVPIKRNPEREFGRPIGHAGKTKRRKKRKNTQVDQPEIKAPRHLRESDQYLMMFKNGFTALNSLVNDRGYSSDDTLNAAITDLSRRYFLTRCCEALRSTPTTWTHGKALPTVVRHTLRHRYLFQTSGDARAKVANIVSTMTALVPDGVSIETALFHSQQATRAASKGSSNTFLRFESAVHQLQGDIKNPTGLSSELWRTELRLLNDLIDIHREQKRIKQNELLDDAVFSGALKWQLAKIGTLIRGFRGPSRQKLNKVLAEFTLYGRQNGFKNGTGSAFECLSRVLGHDPGKDTDRYVAVDEYSVKDMRLLLSRVSRAIRSLQRLGKSIRKK